jgi:hypothetical protein
VAFSFDASQQLEARTGVIFSLLLTVVAFNYSCGDSVPKTPYPTVLDGYNGLPFSAAPMRLAQGTRGAGHRRLCPCTITKTLH